MKKIRYSILAKNKKERHDTHTAPRSAIGFLSIVVEMIETHDHSGRSRIARLDPRAPSSRATVSRFGAAFVRRIRFALVVVVCIVSRRRAGTHGAPSREAMPRDTHDAHARDQGKGVNLAANNAIVER